MRVFLSYRREDSAASSGRLRDALVARLGADNAFLDVSTIRVGEDFESATARALDEADVELVVIGPGWLARRADGGSRLDDAGDYVRREVLRALARGIPVVPVLVRGADLPGDSDLPPELAPLLSRQAVRLHDESWHDDVAALVEDLRERTRRGAIDVRAGTEVVLTTPSGRVGYAVTDAFARARGGGTWRVVVRTVKRNLDHPETYHGEWDYPALVVDGYPTSDGAACFAAVPEQVVPGERGRAAVGFDVSEDPTGGRVELAVEQDDVRGTLAVTR